MTAPALSSSIFALPSSASRGLISDPPAARTWVALAGRFLVYVPQGMTLEPGDIIFTGTPSGVGHARKPNPVWMKQGDVCEIEIEGIGVLRNPIENEA